MPCSVNEQLISVVLWLLQAEPRRADGPGSPDGTGTLLLFLQVQGGHLVGFESAGISVAAIEDVSSERWPMAFLKMMVFTGIQRTINPTPQLKSTDIFLKGRNISLFPTPVLRNGWLVLAEG